MPRKTMDRKSGGTRHPSSDDDELRILFSRITCACAETAEHADAPMARALFNRVEMMKQPPPLAARALGIEPGDASYLLTGLREDVAEDLVLVMLAGRSSTTNPQSKGKRT
jgi:hypothetical protein